MTPTRARAFCGFYVAGADSSLYSDASMVVLMREGQRTVLSMQNAYSGPPSDFAMVVPVPEVLHEEDVRTLPREIFQKVDRLSAPRLVEYWEEDPCRPQYDYALTEAMPTSAAVADGEAGGGGYQVRVEARFSVAEYDVVVLSAGDSNGLERWLHDEGYNIPAGAARVLRPYVEGGTKFFVAKVDVQRVQFDANGRAVLSPLRFHFDDPHFQLPVRLGLLNSQGEQDLIVHTLGLGTRYEVANYPNATIPTNIVVDQQVREHFGPFYERLIEETLQQHPGAVLTEYAWSASSCDPCPGPTLDGSDIMTLGGDVIPSGAGGDWVLTRLHFRYDEQILGEDLVFRPAQGIRGGNGIPDADGRLEESGAIPSGNWNSFQGRYVQLHRWEGPMDCQNPERGQWGYNSPPVSAPGRLQDPTVSASGLPEGISTGGVGSEGPRGSRGCGRCVVDPQERGVLPTALGALLLGLALMRRRRH
ncbi:MAG: DUF2330 domain-containing protein [Sandaracinaceae bacterium]|nr:DUF2330 domain-containing protein [Myxococcales bacterium]MCB9657100.1 DUF2330 domain-containing protein [Sandaracinaceae bacterium]